MRARAWPAPSSRPSNGRRRVATFCVSHVTHVTPRAASLCAARSRSCTVSTSVTVPASSTSTHRTLPCCACWRTTLAAPCSPVRASSPGWHSAANPTGWPRSPWYKGTATAQSARAAAMERRVSGNTSGRSPGSTSQPGAPAVARTAAAIESPMPGCPASSRCQGKPLARTAASVCSSTVLSPKAARSLCTMPPDAAKRSPRPEASTSTTGCADAWARSFAAITPA